MICKIIGSKKGGSGASVDYLLNEREAEGTAKLLQGDPELTKSLIDGSTFAQKSVVGVLSFEEANLSEVKKREIMEQFEKSFMSGLEKEQYNILWVEHTDKGRLELNFVIPTQEMTTGKRIQPYYHKADLGMKDTFQDYINLKYDLSNPKDPTKEQTITVDDRKLHQKDYKELDLKLHSLVLEGKIDNREEMVALLRESGVEVTREGKDYISVKLPESGKAQRFKGGIYGEEFRGIESIGRIREQETERAREFNKRDVKQELGKLEERVKQQRESRAIQNEKRYAKQPKRVLNDPIHANYHNDRAIAGRGNDRSIELVPLNSPERLASAERVAEGARREEVPHSSKERVSDGRRLPIHTDKRVKNDGITATAITAIRGRVQQRDERFGAQVEGIRKGARSLKTVVLDKVRELGERVVKLAERAKERLSYQGKSRGMSL
jgi:hypothetical protein